jgi:hypothetical protein
MTGDVEPADDDACGAAPFDPHAPARSVSTSAMAIGARRTRTRSDGDGAGPSI